MSDGVPLSRGISISAMAHIAELRLPPGGLAVKTAVGIAGARMRVVLALLSVESVEIAPAIFVAAAILGAGAGKAQAEQGKRHTFGEPGPVPRLRTRAIRISGPHARDAGG